MTARAGGGGGERRAVVGPLALAEALAALLRERVGALVHPVALVCADVPEAHVDALASQARTYFIFLARFMPVLAPSFTFLLIK